MGIYCFITPVSLTVWDFPFFTEFNCPPYDGGMYFYFTFLFYWPHCTFKEVIHFQRRQHCQCCFCLPSEARLVGNKQEVVEGVSLVNNWCKSMK